jgi:hypothetical protein
MLWIRGRKVVFRANPHCGHHLNVKWNKKKLHKIEPGSMELSGKVRGIWGM